MTADDERRMKGRLCLVPKVGVRCDGEDSEEDLTAAGATFLEAGCASGPVNRGEGLSLAGGIKGGGFKLREAGGGRGRREADGSAGFSGLARRRGLPLASGGVGSGFKFPGLGGARKGKTVAGEEGAGRLGGGKEGDGGFGWMCGGGGRLGFGLGRGEVVVRNLDEEGPGLGVFLGGGGVARMLGKVWKYSWDVGWRREGPKVMVGGEGGGSGGPPGPIG